MAEIVVKCGITLFGILMLIGVYLVVNEKPVWAGVAGMVFLGLFMSYPMFCPPGDNNTTPTV